MIKASEGGGGKGVERLLVAKKCRGYRQVQGEVPGSPIFIKQLAPRAVTSRQLLADQHGTTVSMGATAACAASRRSLRRSTRSGEAKCGRSWRKLPWRWHARWTTATRAPSIPVPLRRRHLRLLELNPRLQVEHPVTEMITGVNIPAEEASCDELAGGIPDVRKLYNHSPYSKERLTSRPKSVRRSALHCGAHHSGESDAGQPTSGSIEEINFRSTPDGQLL